MNQDTAQDCSCHCHLGHAVTHPDPCEKESCEHCKKQEEPQANVAEINIGDEQFTITAVNEKGETVPANEHTPTENLETVKMKCQNCEVPNPSMVLNEDNTCSVCGRDTTQPIVEPITNNEIEELKKPIEGEVVPLSETKKSVDNRRPDGKFGPGNIANPNGRPKREWTWQTLIEEYADRHQKLKDGQKMTWREIVVKRLFSEAANGNMLAVKEIMNRTDGMPNQPIGNAPGKNGQAQSFIVENTNYANAVPLEVAGAAIPNGGDNKDTNTT